MPLSPAKPTAFMQSRRGWASAACLAIALLGATSPLPAESRTAAPSSAGFAAAGTGPYVTLLFSRSEITAADNCVRNDSGIARLDTVVAPYLAARGMTATGTLVTAKTNETTTTCIP